MQRGSAFGPRQFCGAFSGTLSRTLPPLLEKTHGCANLRGNRDEPGKLSFKAFHALKSGQFLPAASPEAQSTALLVARAKSAPRHTRVLPLSIVARIPLWPQYETSPGTNCPAYVHLFCLFETFPPFSSHGCMFGSNFTSHSPQLESYCTQDTARQSDSSGSSKQSVSQSLEATNPAVLSVQAPTL